jgi:helix-turn-helix protein
MIGVSRSWLYDAARTGRIPSIPLGGPDGPLRFFSKQELEDWLTRSRDAWRPGDSSVQTLDRAWRNRPAA